MPLAKVIRSGSTPKYCAANGAPSRPQPVITSSSTSRMPCFVQMSRSRARAVVGTRVLERGAAPPRPGFGKDPPPQARGRDPRNALGKPERQRMAKRERGGEIELARLLADRLDDARPAVAGVDAP